MIRRIFVPLIGGEGDPTALAAAFAVAGRLLAHVDVALLRFDQRYVRPKLSEPLPPGLFEEIATLLADEDGGEAQARRQFDAARQAAGAVLVEQPCFPASSSARWLGNRPAERIVRDGRLSDLVVVGPQRSRENSRAGIVRRAALVTAGRPLLLACDPLPAALGGRVAIAWNGSAGGAQAVAVALPLLAKADAVEVLTVKTAKTRSSEGERLVDYLAWHGIVAQSHVLGSDGNSVGSTLLHGAAERSADLLVMGGHVQKSWQDLLLGGVTGFVLDEAQLPILIAH